MNERITLDKIPVKYHENWNIKALHDKLDELSLEEAHSLVLSNSFDRELKSHLLFKLAIRFFRESMSVIVAVGVAHILMQVLSQSKAEVKDDVKA